MTRGIAAKLAGQRVAMGVLFTFWRIRPLA
jgi:hypothetical protein